MRSTKYFPVARVQDQLGGVSISLPLDDDDDDDDDDFGISGSGNIPKITPAFRVMVCPLKML